MKEETRKFKIAWLFPDVLYLHGERGNVLALERVSRALGLEPEVNKIDVEGEDFEPLAYDLIFCPPGELSSFPRVIEKLAPAREALLDFVASGRVLLATGTSVCVFGERTERLDGSAIDGLGLLACTFKERRLVYGDDLYVKTSYCPQYDQCFGVQVQMVDVESREEPFAEIIYGYGNNEGKSEGMVKNNSIFTNMLGPALVLNPWLTKEIVLRAARAGGLKLGDQEPGGRAAAGAAVLEADAALAKTSLEVKRDFALSKRSNLKNTRPL